MSKFFDVIQQVSGVVSNPPLSAEDLALTRLCSLRDPLAQLKRALCYPIGPFTIMGATFFMALHGSRRIMEDNEGLEYRAHRLACPAQKLDLLSVYRRLKDCPPYILGSDYIRMEYYVKYEGKPVFALANRFKTLESYPEGFIKASPVWIKALWGLMRETIQQEGPSVPFLDSKRDYEDFQKGVPLYYAENIVYRDDIAKTMETYNTVARPQSDAMAGYLAFPGKQQDRTHQAIP